MHSNRAFEILWAQTWQVGLLAAVVWVVVRLCGRDRPHLSHCLWALVLVKCLMPPVWTSPVGLFCWINAQANQLTSVQWFAPSTNMSQQLQAESETDPDLAIRIFDAFDSVAARGNSSQQASSLTSRTQPRTTAMERGRQWVLGVWLIGCMLSFSAAIVRLGLFWRFVRRSSVPRKHANHNANIEQLVHRLRAQLRVSRRVRISVMDAAVGPAVYGLVRPNILLPAAIVQNRTLRELEPLVAHELIHIRRGDLWWALVQTLALGLFWFHPLVWLAHAMLVREAERSCDEETIASLRCSPATYARSLLDVLESKQRLRVAPALPGVRPVDVTRNRLERIMRLGQGSHVSTPVWIWLVFLGGVAILLPGGAWLTAQEGQTGNSQQPIASEKLENASPPLVPPAKGAWAESWKNEKIDVGDLLDTLESQHGDREVARGMLLSMIPQRSIHALNAEGGVAISAVPAFSIDGDDLHLFETREQIATIIQGLDELRRYGFDSVQLQLKLMAISVEQLDALGLTWERAVEPSSDMLARAQQIPTPQEKIPTSQEIQSGRGLPMAPAALYAVQPASAVSEIAQPRPAPAKKSQSKAKGREQAENNHSLSESVLSDLGIAGRLAVAPRTEFIVGPTHCAVIDAEKVTAISRIAESGDKSILARPRLICRNGGYAQVISYTPWSIKPQIASFDRPAPTQPLPQLGFGGFSLAALPLIETKAEGDAKPSVDLSLVCETREVTRLDRFTFKGRLTNAVDGETATKSFEQPNVEMKRLAVRHKLRAGESLLISSRERLAPTSDNKVLVILASCEVLPGGTNKYAEGQALKSSVQRPKPTTGRLPILGPHTSGAEVERLPGPSTSEVLAAWRKASPNDQVLAGLNDSRIRIIENCIGEFEDETSVVPLIEGRVLHHRIYKCDVYQIEDSDKSEMNPTWLGTVVIDHNHFHRLDGNPTK